MLAKKIALNTIISVAGRVLSTGLALVSIGLLTRSLSRADWGEYSIMLTFGGIFAVLADLGLYQYLVREISREGADEREIASQVFSFRLAASLLIFGAAPLVSLAFPYSAQARWGIVIGMAGFWFLSGAQVLMGVFQKHLRMEKVALAELAGRLIQLGLIWLAIELQLGFYAIVATFVLSAAINFLLVWLMARWRVGLHLSFDWPYWQKIFSVSYPLAISGVLTMIYFSTDSLILSIFWPAETVGAYRLPYKILESLIFFPAMFVGLIMPVLSKTAFNDRAKFKQVFQKANDILVMLALPLVAGTFFVSPQIVDLLGGGNYPEAAVILNLLMLAVGVIFFGSLFSFGLIALEGQKKLLRISAWGAIFNLAANFILIPKFSYWAAAATTVLTELLVTILMLAAIKKISQFRPSFSVLNRVLLALLPMAAFLFYFQQSNFVFLISGGGLIYLAALYLTGAISLGEIKELIKK